MEDSRMGTGSPLDENDKHRLVLQLVQQLRCVECGRLYDPEDFAFIHRWPEVWVLSTRCRYCDDLCHVVIFMQLDTGPEPLLEMTPEEAEAAAQLPPITADDVLDVHLLLQRPEADLEELFAG
jgi:hypothetical protein